MTNSSAPACPHCGSRQLVLSSSNRKIFINHEGERIPLLTANFSLGFPVIEEKTQTLTYSWTGSANEFKAG